MLVVKKLLLYFIVPPTILHKANIPFPDTSVIGKFASSYRILLQILHIFLTFICKTSYRNWFPIELLVGLALIGTYHAFEILRQRTFSREKLVK
jgi:hypothetical protein